MPKYIPTYDDIYIEKYCGYCGSRFVPLKDEDCCTALCGQLLDSYYEDHEQFFIDELLRMGV